MKKIIVVFIILLSLVLGCSEGEIPLTKEKEFKIICLDGVQYYFFKESVPYLGYGFMSVKFNKNSKICTCEEGKKGEK